MKRNTSTKGDRMTVSLKTLQNVLGMVVGYRVGALTLPVVILDARMSYGKLQYEVAPIDGKGRTWLDSASVELPVVVPVSNN
jgi:hypothetical protein